ncbi:hypothetical protein SteCoe_8677 [Stentor coeruleus]|uniref:Uncharacterized protein n=1 Tax=Stentor coeruleus TaxID=5963 RepID=A0A1R2CJN2_9CILI|nr:hypothetical protein SteCoe_8677 [Stentor coeruleus]
MDDSVAVKDSPAVVEEKLQGSGSGRAEVPKSTQDKEDNKQSKPQSQKKKLKKSTDNNFKFEIPKMKGIPILNKYTVNPNTFDLNYLLNPDVQKSAQSGHRFIQSSNGTQSNKNLGNHKSPTQKTIANNQNNGNSKSNKELSTIAILEKKYASDIEERFYKKAKQTEEKIKAWKEQKEQEEKSGCTFKPQIKAKRENKTYNEYYEYMKEHVQKKENKIKSIKEEEIKNQEKNAENFHQPKLCEKSLQMIARKSDLEESAFDRLHKQYKSASRKSINTVSREFLVSDFKNENSSLFQPTVNKKSQMLNRSDPVEKILYDDALRRIGKDKNPPIPTISKYITSKSEKVLIDKLKRDFEEAFISISSDTSTEINYTKMIELFKSMYFIKDELKKEDERLLLLDSWKILSIEGDSYCRKPSILVFIIAVMGFYEDWMSVSDENRLALTNCDANKIHAKFDLFYTNRVSVINKSTVNKSYKTNYDYSFHPQTVMESESLAKNWRSQNRAGGKIEDVLLAEKAKTQKKLEEKRLELEEHALDECSFQPIIEQMPEEWRVYGQYEKEDLTSEYFKIMNDPKFQNTHKGVALHDLAKVMKQRKDEKSNTTKKIKEEKELEDCTFSPKLKERIFPKDYLPCEFKPKPLYEKPEKSSFNEGSERSPRMSEKSPRMSEKSPRMSEKSPKMSEKSPRMSEKGEKFASDDKIKAYNDLKKLAEENVVKTKWPELVSNNEGVAVFSIKLPKSTERFEFNINNDDPASRVMEFSKIHGLKKEEEYRLVKELTLLKTLN